MNRPSRETLGERMTTHGHSKGRVTSPTYRSWVNMLSRCRLTSSTSYAVYGGAGVTVCARWNSFAAFLEDMGERPSLDHTLDRFPNGSGNYEPGNCRWATRSEQARNRRTTRPVIRDDGLMFASIIEAAEATGGNRHCIRDVCIGRQKSHLGRTWRYAP